MRVEIFVFPKVANFDTQQVFNTARDVVAFKDLRRGIHRLFESTRIFVKLLRQSDHHKDRDPWRENGPIYDSAIALDHATSLKLLDPP